jgi:lipopolysaccharide transport system ATP-binding protein
MVSTFTREWPDPTKAPGGNVARLRAVRVRTEDGQITDTVDIRRPVNIEVEYEVLEPGRVFLSYIQFHTQNGVLAFEAIDLDPMWRGRPRPCGRWVSIARIPGNLLSEGILFVTPGLITQDHVSRQFFAREAVAFQVVDTLEGDSARGDWNGNFEGIGTVISKELSDHF